MNLPLRTKKDAIYKEENNRYLRLLPIVIRPVPTDRGPIIGWGAKSAAIRVRTEQESFVVVVKPIHDIHAYPVEDDPQMNTASKHVISNALEQHLHRSFYVLGDGMAGKPALLKIGREIHGVPMAEHHPLLLFSDDKAISNTISLFTDVLLLAKKEGILVDLWETLAPDFFAKF